MVLITNCRSIHGSTVVRAGLAGLAAAGGVLALIMLANRVPELAWLMFALAPVYFLLSLPLGVLAGRLMRLSQAGRTTVTGWVLAILTAEAVAWLPSGFDAIARVFFVAPFLALLLLPIGCAVAAGLVRSG